MKRSVIFIVIGVLFLSACAPSQQTIQTAIAQTQVVWTPIPTQTAFPTVVKIITQTQVVWTPVPTQTAVPTVVSPPCPGDTSFYSAVI